jgi:leucyl aminopeptidase
LFSNDDGLRDKMRKSGDKVRERLWPMPLFEDYRETIDSQVADIKNGGGRTGGVGTSAIFLKEFTNYPWAHVDMAGLALTEKGYAYIPLGATGFGVRLLVDLLRNW